MVCSACTIINAWWTTTSLKTRQSSISSSQCSVLMQPSPKMRYTSYRAGCLRVLGEITLLKSCFTAGTRKLLARQTVGTSGKVLISISRPGWHPSSLTLTVQWHTLGTDSTQALSQSTMFRDIDLTTRKHIWTRKSQSGMELTTHRFLNNQTVQFQMLNQCGSIQYRMVCKSHQTRVSHQSRCTMIVRFKSKSTATMKRLKCQRLFLTFTSTVLSGREVLMLVSHLICHSLNRVWTVATAVTRLSKIRMPIRFRFKVMTTRMRLPTLQTIFSCSRTLVSRRRGTRNRRQ